jgi:hypothetical protein
MDNQNEINQQGNNNPKNDFRSNNRRGRGGFNQRPRGGRGMGRGRGYSNPVRRNQNRPRNPRNQNQRGGFSGQNQRVRRNRREYNIDRRDNNRVRNNL